MEYIVVFFAKTMGFTPEYTMSLTNKQVKGYLEALDFFNRKENGEEKEQPLLNEEAVRKRADEHIKRLKAKRGKDYRPSILDLAGSGIA